MRRRLREANVAEQDRLENIVARQLLARRVEHSEHAVGAIDAGGRDQHHAAAVEQEIGEPAALRRVETAEDGQEVVAHLQDALLRRATALRVPRCKRVAPGARTWSRKNLSSVSLSISRGRAFAPCPTWIAPSSRGFWLGLSAGVSRSRRAHNRMVSVVSRWKPSMTSSVPIAGGAARARTIARADERARGSIAVDEQHRAEEVLASRARFRPRRAPD